MKIRILSTIIGCILCGAAGYAQDTTYHIVKEYETLYGIANRQKVAADSILKWNNLKIVTKTNKEGKQIKDVQPQIATGQKLIVGIAAKATSETITEQPEEEKPEDVVVTPNNDTSKNKPENRRTNNQNKEKGNASSRGGKKSSSWWWFWLIAGFVGGIFCWEKWLRKRIFDKDNSKKPVNPELDALNKDYTNLQEKYKQLVNQIGQRDYQIKIIGTQYNEIFEENIQLGEQIEGYKYKAKSFSDILKETAGQTHNESNTRVGESQNATLYADSIVNNAFNRVVETPNEDTVYEITKTSSRTATFRIYSDAYKRVIKNPDFIDGCEKQRINQTPSTLEIENGETVQDDFGKWQITKKAKIKFI
jgi:LysM repeat protein